MFCSRCGDPVEPNEIYCNKCGNNLNGNIMINAQKKDNNIKMIFIGAGIGVVALFVILIATLMFKPKQEVYFSDENYEDEQIVEQSQTSTKGKYSTVIIADREYAGVKISNVDDANELIVKDSVSQKDACPNEIKKIENNIIKKYNITAVNLCELDVGFANEIEKVFEKIYNEYPSVRGHLTNLSLYNTSGMNTPVAVFMWSFPFATSDTSSTFPWVIKTQILLNTKYFLNPERLESAVKASSESGHFPKNTTRYSPVAHEMGHYLSFLATMKKHSSVSNLLIDDKNYDVFYETSTDFSKGDFSLTMIKEAFENYKKSNNTNLSFDEWRATISQYAVAKDESGNYIYDETIAEAFHDVYLNDTKAQDASKYIVNVLKQKLES